MKISIRGNIIEYDEKTKEQPLEKILSARFHKDDFGKTIQDLFDPYLLKDMDKAVKRLMQAHKKKEKVIIFGDYDVDGVTSTSILMHFFKKIGMVASYRLPHRVKDGYGMKKYFMDELEKIGVTLVVTVDCGTKDVEVIDYAKTLGIDIIVTDHHAVPSIIPDSVIALINPKRTDCDYPFKYLSGAGVAYKLMMALARNFFSEEQYDKYLQESIDIAAIGTVADCMPLIGENRIIVQEGLKQLKQSRSKGIRKLIQEKMNHDLDADIFGFLIGPRINAAGRLDSPYKALDLILNNGEKIDEILEEIEQINNKRKDLTKTYIEHALENIDTSGNIIFYVSSDIEHGIIGVVAGRITEMFYKPCIVFKDEGDKLVASCRSPEYFSLVDYLDIYKDFFIYYGGHKQAAGFTIKKEMFVDFQQKFIQEINTLDFSQHKKTILIDKILLPEEFGFHIVDTINEYKPYGIGNKKPLFLFENIGINQVVYVGKTFEHISIKNNYGITILGFGFGEFMPILQSVKTCDIVFDIMDEIWMGKRILKCKIVDIIV